MNLDKGGEPERALQLWRPGRLGMHEGQGVCTGTAGLQNRIPGGPGHSQVLRR